MDILKHDTYVSAVQKILNTSDVFVQPEYVSGYIFELRNDTSGNFYVQVLYKNNKPNDPITFEPVTIYGNC